MFGNGGDDRNVNFGVSSIPQRVKSTGPGSDGAGDCEKDEPKNRNTKDTATKSNEKGLKLFARQLLAEEVEESNKLNETEDAQGSHMVAASNGAGSRRTVLAC